MTVICDIDGVVVRGDQAVPGAGPALRRLLGAGVDVVFATNNSMSTPAMVVDRIARLTGVGFPAEAVVTSSQAAARLLGANPGPVMVMGGQGIVEAMHRAGAEITEEPETAVAVVVGLDRSLSYQRLSRAVSAVRGGARFIATNTDPTYPVAGGVLPGGGAMVAAVAVASGVQPEVAGKPHAAMREELRARGVGRAWVIGDRADTDVALAGAEEDWRSILVLSGVTENGEASGADHVVTDLTAAVDLVLGSLSPP